MMWISMRTGKGLKGFPVSSLQSPVFSFQSPVIPVIGQVDRGARQLLHEGAIYLHEGRSYHVRQLDLDNHLATVAPTTVDYYTEVTSEAEIEVLTTHEERTAVGATVAHGELLVTSQVVGYRRVKHFTHENLGVFPLEYTPQQLETSGYWFSLTADVQMQLAEQGQWFDSVNDYGPTCRRSGLRPPRDGYRCSQSANAPRSRGASTTCIILSLSAPLAM
ncbi:MAG: hypothetical protein R2932_19000 [Caldilineaceae bacterium]